MFERLWEARFKIVVLAFGVILAFVLLGIILSLVTHTTWEALMANLFSDEIRFALGLSLLTSIISTVLCIIIAIPAAYGLVRYKFWGISIINIILDAPLALPPLVAGIALLIFFGTTPIGKFLADIGFVFVFTVPGIIVAQFFVNCPFMYRILRSTFQGINPRYENVAQTLGCTDAKAFWHVTLPMAKNGLIAGALITWCRGIGEFGAVLMLAGSTRMRTETLPIALYLNISSGEMDMAVAAAAILIIIAGFSLFVFERYGGAARVY